MLYWKSDDFSITLFREDVEEEGTPEGWGPEISLAIVKGDRKMVLQLAVMRAEELMVLKDLFGEIFDKALGVALDRDRIAQEGYSSGDDSFVRLYRRLPEVVRRDEGA